MDYAVNQLGIIRYSRSVE